MVENSIAEHFDAENSDDLQCVVFSKSYNSGDAEKIAKAEKLLVEVHDGIYVQHFPLEDEQEPVDVWKGMLESGDKEGRHVYVAFGKGLDTEHPEIMGFVAAGLYGTNSALIEYVIRTKDAADKLRGTEIVGKAIEELKNLCMNVNGRELEHVYWELNDPKKVEYDENNPDPTVDCMSPQKRLDLVKSRYKGKLLGFDYVQAPLTEGQNVCDALRLARIDVGTSGRNETQEQRNRREAEGLKEYLRDFTEVLTERNPDEVAKQYKQIDKMMKQVDLMIKHGISPLEDLQTAEQQKMLEHALPVASEGKKLNPYVYMALRNARRHVALREAAKKRSAEFRKEFGLPKASDGKNSPSGRKILHRLLKEKVH